MVETMRNRAAWIIVVVGAILVGVATATGTRALSAATSLLALVVAVSTLLVRPPARQRAWWLFVLGSAVVVFGLTASALMLRPLRITQHLQIEDVRPATFFIVVGLGLIFADGRSARRYLADTLDAALFALGAFLVLWLFLLYGRPGQAGADFVTAFGRPIGVALLAGVLFRLIFVVERQTASFRLLVAATTFTLAGGVLRIGAAVGHPYVHRVDDVGALGAGYTVLIAAALVHPDSAVPVPTRQAGIARFSTPRTVVFVLLALLGPLAWAVAVIPGGFEPRSVLEFGVPVMIAALITLLVLWRMALINRFADNRADQLQALHSELVYRATHDQLTHLVNRAELVNHLEALLRGGHVGNARSALLMLDLDGFKGINDSFGHPVGDQLLVDVAARLTTVSASSDTVARLGGDEFAVLLADADEPTARSIANLIRHRLGEPYRTSGRTLSVSASVGVCVIPRVDQSSSEVLRDADLACTQPRPLEKTASGSLTKESKPLMAARLVSRRTGRPCRCNGRRVSGRQRRASALRATLERRDGRLCGGQSQ